MNNLIFEIAEERRKQGISETALAAKIGVDQNKVWRLLNGKTKRLDLDLIEKLRGALGMVADPQEEYGSVPRFQVVRQVEPKKEKASSPLAAAILALVEAMTPEQQAAELKRLTDQFTASQTTEKS